MPANEKSNKALYPNRDVNFTNAEMIELAEHLNHPAVQKYLKLTAQSSQHALCTGKRFDNELAESFLERRAAVMGGLEVLETLLSIEPVTKTA
jgi:hypothetical protein